MERLSTNRVVELAQESVTRDQDSGRTARPMAVIQGTDGDTGTVSTNASVGQNIKTPDRGRGVISRMSLGNHQNINFFQAHHHLSSSKLRRARGAGFTSGVPGADSEAPLLQRHRRCVSQ